MIEYRIANKEDFYKLILNANGIKNNDWLKGFIQYELEILNTPPRTKAERKRIKNEEIKKEILKTLMSARASLSVAQIKENNKKLSFLPSQKITALLIQLQEEGIINKQTTIIEKTITVKSEIGVYSIN